MTDELTGADIDGRLADLGIAYRWRASVEGYSIVYSSPGLVSPDRKKLPKRQPLVNCLLKLRAVIEAIDNSGSANGVPLRSFQVPLLVSEYKQLQAEACSRLKGKAGGSAGKGRERSVAVLAIRKMFDDFGRDKKTEAYLAWLQQGKSQHCEYHSDDDAYEFHSRRLKSKVLARHQVQKTISRERKKT